MKIIIFKHMLLESKSFGEINDETLPLGTVIHSIGWPLYNNAYGGSFMYKISNNMLQ